MSVSPEIEELPRSWSEQRIEQLFAPLEDGRTLHQGWSPQCDKVPSTSEDSWAVLKTTAIQAGSAAATLPASFRGRKKNSTASARTSTLASATTSTRRIVLISLRETLTPLSRTRVRGRGCGKPPRNHGVFLRLELSIHWIMMPPHSSSLPCRATLPLAKASWHAAWIARVGPDSAAGSCSKHCRNRPMVATSERPIWPVA